MVKTLPPVVQRALKRGDSGTSNETAHMPDHRVGNKHKRIELFQKVRLAKKLLKKKKKADRKNLEQQLGDAVCFIVGRLVVMR